MIENLIHNLSEKERSIILECLQAAEQEIFFPEWEFETLFGISRKQLSSVREQWPDVDVSNPDVGSSIVGAMNHLLGYPHGQPWDKHVSVPPDYVFLLLKKLIVSGL